MKSNKLALATLSILLVLTAFVSKAQDRRYDASRGNQGYPIDNRNPYDTRNRSFDNYNPYDPRPQYDSHGRGHGRGHDKHHRHDDDFRCGCEARVYCEHRQRWASSHYPLDPRNPYDVRNQRVSYDNREPERRVVVVKPAVVVSPSVVVHFPVRVHQHGY